MPAVSFSKCSAHKEEQIYEYFKKGYEPTEYDTSNITLPAPSNLRISEKDNKVTLDLTLKEEKEFYEFSFDIENKGTLDAILDEYNLSIDNKQNIIANKVESILYVLLLFLLIQEHYQSNYTLKRKETELLPVQLQ